MDITSSLPLNLHIKQSECPGRRYEVWSSEEIPVGVRFGPYQEAFVRINKNVKKDSQWQLEGIDEETANLDERNESESNWLEYVNYCHKEEQNMIAIGTESGVYYLMCRSIPANTKLLVHDKENIVPDKEEYERDNTGNSKGTESNDLRIDRNFSSESYMDIIGESEFTRSKIEATAENIQLVLRKGGSSTHTTSQTDPICVREGKSNTTNEGKSIHKENLFQNENTNDFTDTHKPKANKCKETRKRIKYKLDKNIYESERTCAKTIDVDEQRMCREKVVSRKYLNVHKRICTTEKPECNACGKLFRTRNNANEFQIIHSGEKLFECKVCGKKFPQSKLIAHERIDSGMKPFECNSCGKKFTHRSSLTQHERIHTGEKCFECNACGKKFTQRNNFVQHERIHTGIKPFQCNACGKKFTQRKSLIGHERIHTGMKPFACNSCGKKFTHSNYLLVHQRIHTGEKCFECNACGKKFTLRNSLMQHIRIHTGMKPYECNACGKKFTVRNSLTQHERIHTGMKPFECNSCGKKFTQRSSLTMHERIHIGEKCFECNACGKKFTHRSYLTRHEKIHTGIKPFDCNACGKKFTHKSNLLVHKRIHTGEKPFNCNACGKKFTQRRSLIFHEGNVCGKKFTLRA